MQSAAVVDLTAFLLLSYGFCSSKPLTLLRPTYFIIGKNSFLQRRKISKIQFCRFASACNWIILKETTKCVRFRAGVAQTSDFFVNFV